MPGKKISVLCKLKIFQQPRILFKLLLGAQFEHWHFGPVICNNIPTEIRSIKHFDTFNTEIRKWKPKNCWWKLCKTYVKDLSFLNISQ